MHWYRSSLTQHGKFANLGYEIFPPGFHELPIQSARFPYSLTGFIRRWEQNRNHSDCHGNRRRYLSQRFFQLVALTPLMEKMTPNDLIAMAISAFIVTAIMLISHLFFIDT